MSEEKAEYEAQRWLRQAQDDWEAAHILYTGGKYAQACFLSQQAAEKAVKAIWYAVGVAPWGHSVLRLVREVPDETLGARLKECEGAAAFLDQFYVPTRYPNGLPDLTPSEVYRAEDAQRGLKEASRLIQAVEGLLA
ncbi:MAG: HEPN domain-containing protein [Anaerolineae bacterium]|jgi:HEPN domain-containing protein|nr:HEPN domain-containing protein [Anaerolineae bacterium]MDH7474488.1 HEPN domain-containing protein [Anaerolineae bacterium]